MKKREGGEEWRRTSRMRTGTKVKGDVSEKDMKDVKDGLLPSGLTGASGRQQADGNS